MQFANLIEGRLVRRYKRFLADVELADGEVITAHCANTGAMTGCAEPGSRVWLSLSDTKTRKYPHTWELVETANGMACIRSVLANQVVGEALAARQIPALADFTEVHPEVKYGSGSRIDFLLQGERESAYLEVKCVTLCRAKGIGVFPDAPSERGRKHLRELAAIRQPDVRAVMFFCVFHQGIDRVAAAGDIDPAYRAAMGDAMAAGVETMAWNTTISPEGIRLDRELTFSLDA